MAAPVSYRCGWRRLHRDDVPIAGLAELRIAAPAVGCAVSLPPRCFSTKALRASAETSAIGARAENRGLLAAGGTLEREGLSASSAVRLLHQGAGDANRRLYPVSEHLKSRNGASP